MALKDPVGAQKLAVNYLESIGEELEGQLIVGGHSKGGNLAVFSSAYCKKEIQDRITAVYSHDGPGFLATDLEYIRCSPIYDKIHKTIPQASFVGMLLECECQCKVVQSNGTSIGQHDPLTWRVEDGHLVEVEDRTRMAKNSVERFNNWVWSLDFDQRIIFLDGFFTMLDELHVSSIHDLAANFVQYFPNLVTLMKNMEAEQRRIMFTALQVLNPFHTESRVKPGKVFPGSDTVLDLDTVLEVGDERDEELKDFRQKYDLFINRFRLQSEDE